MEIIQTITITGAVIIFSLLGFLFGLVLGFGMWIDSRKKKSNKLSDRDRELYEKDGYLVLSPSGDTQDFIFSPSGEMHRCGKAYFGMSLDGHKYYYKNKHSYFLGGVIDIKDIKRLSEHLNKHIEVYEEDNK